MKRHLKTYQVCTTFACVTVALSMLCSCSDDYAYDDREPDFLGSSIYEYLQSQGDFKTYLRLIDDLNYKEVLSLTGSKTIFPANDEAFERFFQSNEYGVSSYELLSPAQKRSLLNSSMINMAYLSNMLANPIMGENTANEGTAIRRPTSSTYLDSIEHVKNSPILASPFWTRFAEKGLYLIDGESNPYIVHFTPQNTTVQKVKAEDWTTVMGKEYNASDIYINGHKVVKADVTCKNGYVHEVEDVLTPNKNLSQIIASNGQTNLFNELMNKFSAPYFNSNLDKNVHELYNGSDASHPSITDSVFVKQYFTDDNTKDPKGNDMTNYGLLYYDPSQNSYSSMQDMGAMFVPTDEAMNAYFNSGKGKYLADAYGSWENVPTSLLALFIKNHQKKSLMTSLPSQWPTMNDESSFPMKVNKSDIVKSYIGSNGIVFVTNKVYPPIDYQTVYAASMTNSHSRIMNWALQDKEMKFYLYLRSMENMYNLLVPTDEALQNYRDPISWAKGKSQRRIWAFKYDETKDNPISIDVYTVNENGQKDKLERTITDKPIIRNRLNDICDRHIVVGEMDKEGNMSGYIDNGTKSFAQSKGGSSIKIQGSGDNLRLMGGGDIEQGIHPAQIAHHPTTGQLERYDADNGRIYFLDKVLQDPISSVKTILSKHSEYTDFYNLLLGNSAVFKYFDNDNEIKSIFGLNKTSKTSGLGEVVTFFNNFRYTVFVPSNASLKKAFAEDKNLHTWEEIEAEENVTKKRQWAIHLIRFLKYHFMDNSIYINGESFSNRNYETAARNNSSKFQTLRVSSDGSNLSITDAHGNTAHVSKQQGLYNVQGRDIIVNNADYSKADQIESSSFSVIHLIDKALLPE